MSASAGSCRVCAAPIPAGARFCPECGTPVGGERVPANVVRVEPRYFGVAPPTLVLVVAVLVLATGIVLLVLGRILAGVLLVVTAAPLLFAFVIIARAHPDSRFARGVVRALDRAEGRIGLVTGVVSASAGARRETARVRSELAALDAARQERMLALAEAAYRDDADAVRTLRAELSEIDDARRAKQDEEAAIAADADERIRRAKLEAQPTQALDEPVADVPAPEDPRPR